MKHLFSLLILACMISCSKPTDLNVMSFNIRNDNAGDSLNAWPYRKDVAAEVVKLYDIDVLGTQEVLVNQLNDLKSRLPEYNVVGVGRADGAEKGEYCAVFYKKDRFTELESGSFWLSETPEVAGSKGWDGACERIASWVRLQDKKSRKQFFFINTHLDHVGKVARREGVALLLDRTKEYAKGSPIIITGDFNSEPDSEVIQHVIESGEFRGLIAPEVPGTFHDFGRIPVERRKYIDFIFVTDAFDVLSCEVLPEKHQGIFLSDHMPVVSRLTLK
jgi:endonuclease/exonuclease/phosphatase family metal-dependent hydrolase